MSTDGRDIVDQMFREALERHQEQARTNPPPPPPDPPTIHFTELPDAQPDSQIYQEWNHYRREVARLLAEGQEGRWVLIKGDEIIGIWETKQEAYTVALEKYLMQPCLIQQILSREPLVRGPLRFWRCRS